MPDVRFKDEDGRCKLCHKLCFDSEKDGDDFILAVEAGLTYSYECPLYPSGYWHVTSSANRFKPLSHNVALLKLGPKREKRIRKRIRRLLSL